MDSIVLLSASITLFLISILFLDQSNIDNYNRVDAISIGENGINYISTLPPVGKPVPVPNNPFSTAEGTPEIV